VQAAAGTPKTTGVSPAATFETKLRDPVLPEALRSVTPTPPTTGDAFKAQVEQRLRAPFDAANAKRAGTLTLEEARAAGLGYVVNNFAAIDTRGTGTVTFEDVKAFMRAQGAPMLPD